jgi:hypothetical protein
MSPPGFADLWDGSTQHEDAVISWFWAAYLMTTNKRGISALLLQR